MQLKNIPWVLLREELDRLDSERVVERIWNRDHTVWSPDPAEISNRLGWLQSHEEMKTALPEIEQFVEEVRADGVKQVLLLGMGGSSLAPEVFGTIFGSRNGYPSLEVLDTTDPGAILHFERKSDLKKTLIIVSTKSGGTVETLSLMKYFYSKVSEEVGEENAGQNFIAITDPGSKLEEKAEALGFRKVFLNNPDIGGRYSSLSYFGLVPAGLLGIDLQTLLEKAKEMAVVSKAGGFSAKDGNTPALLGAALSAMGKSGQDKITLIASEKIRPFGLWLEQLLAESTGKKGKGLLPVDSEPLLKAAEYGPDRLFIIFSLNQDPEMEETAKTMANQGLPLIRLGLPDIYSLGGEMFRWMMATAIAGWSLQINPFDQPDVESAKVLARDLITEYEEKGRLKEAEPDFELDCFQVYLGCPRFKANSLEEGWQGFFSALQQASTVKMGALPYVAIQAYLQPDPETDRALQLLRQKIGSLYRVAVTVGYGPRFLHSTGQLHKGDAGNGFFIQLTAEDREDVIIPGGSGSGRRSISFGTLKKAQALGDWQALLDAGRKAIRFHIVSDAAGGIDKLTQALQKQD